MCGFEQAQGASEEKSSRLPRCFGPSRQCRRKDHAKKVSTASLTLFLDGTISRASNTDIQVRQCQTFQMSPMLFSSDCAELAVSVAQNGHLVCPSFRNGAFVMSAPQTVNSR